MAKKKHDLKKMERVQLLLDLLSSTTVWTKRRLIKSTVGSSNGSKQSTYRDLRELVNFGRLHERRRMANGTTELASVDGVPGPYKSEWYFPKTTDQYVGSGIIEKSAAKILYSTRLKGLFRVMALDRGQVVPEDRVNFNFRLAGQDICPLGKHSLFSVVIGRFKDLELAHALGSFEAIESRWGHRIIYLHLDLKSVSSYRGPELPGHCIFEFGEHGRVAEVIDFKSTNHCYLELPHSRQEWIRGACAVEPAAYLRTINVSTEMIQPMEALSLQLPFKVICGQYPFTVYGS